MPGTAGPNLGLVWGYDPGESGWGVGGYNPSMARLDTVVQLAVFARQDVPAMSPAIGDRYIVGPAGSGAWAGHADAIASYSSTGWTFLSPRSGWHTYNAATGTVWVYDGGWNELEAGITELDGDVIAGPGSGLQTATLADTTVVAGSYSYASVTVDSKGRITAASSGTPPTGGGTSVTVSDALPSGSTQGDLWFNSVEAQLYVYYDDGSSGQFVPATNQVVSGGTGVGGSSPSFLLGEGFSVDNSTTPSTVNMVCPIPIDDGGTGAVTAEQALINLGAAPINSPAFTGTPTAPTPAPTSNDATIVTSAWVKAQGYSSGGSITFPLSVSQGGTGATDLPASPAGSIGLTTLVHVNGTAPIAPISDDAMGTVGTWGGGQLACVGISPEAGIAFSSSGGSLSAPTALTAGNNLGSLWFSGYGTTDWGIWQGGQISCCAIENFTDSAQGTSLTFDITQPGTTTGFRVLTLATGNSTLASGLAMTGGSFSTRNSTSQLQLTPNLLSFKVNAGDDSTAGTIDYGVSYSGTMAINGLGTSGNRRIDLSDNVYVSNNLEVLNNLRVSQSAEVLNGSLNVWSGYIRTSGSQSTYYFRDQSAPAVEWQLYATAGAARIRQAGDLLIVDNSGNLTITGATATKPGGGSWVAPSERSLKTSVAEWSTGLQAVLALTPISYKYLNETWNIEQDYIGLDAAEASAVIPEMAREINMVPHVEHHEGEPDVITVAALDFQPLLMALCNAIRELEARVAELELRPGWGPTDGN